MMAMRIEKVRSHALLVAVMMRVSVWAQFQPMPYSAVRVVGGEQFYGTVVAARSPNLYFILMTKAQAWDDSGFREHIEVFLPQDVNARAADLVEWFPCAGGHVMALYRTTVNDIDRRELHRFSARPVEPGSMLSTLADATYRTDPGFTPRTKEILKCVSTQGGLLNLVVEAKTASRWYEGMPVYDRQGKLLGVVSDPWHNAAEVDLTAVSVNEIKRILTEYSAKQTSGEYDSCTYFDLGSDAEGLSDCEQTRRADQERAQQDAASKEHIKQLSAKSKQYLRLSKRQPFTLCLHGEGVLSEFCGWTMGGLAFINPDGLLRVQARVQYSQWGSLYDDGKKASLTAQGVKNVHVTMPSLEYAAGLELGDAMYLTFLVGIGEQGATAMRYSVSGKEARVKIPASQWRYTFWQAELGLEARHIRYGIGVRKVIGDNPDFFQFEVKNATGVAVKPAEFIERNAFAYLLSASYRLHGWWSPGSKQEALKRARELGY